MYLIGNKVGILRESHSAEVGKVRMKSKIEAKNGNRDKSLQ